MAGRIESPSSINTYRQCPRKYYYVYIAKYPTLPSIHLIRGNVAHKALEDFFDIDDKDLDKIGLNDYHVVLKTRMKRLLKKHWLAGISEFRKLDISNDQHLFYFRETQEMLQRWTALFIRKLGKEIEKHGGLKQAFRQLTPDREFELNSQVFRVKGYIDCIEKNEGRIRVMDYKTSKSCHMSEGYKLQLAIYSLLYYEQYGKLPDEVGIYFLRHDEHTMPVDEQLLEFARKEVELIHQKNQSDDINDYPKKEGPLCKYSTGQCDFYDLCFNSNNDSQN